MSQKLTRITAIIVLIALSACATVDGMGRDISSAGRSISKTAG